ncbi:Sir2 family NAD-dependent protein deacetylase [Clostridium sp. MCC353]|uniref:Sir2 family NAD-dependent protein deacetylase n=1 Tax=Clostridium sp. MCC353 TaxID=2592646 RepID=UPI001C031515|nr:Sir2 family NAD-dependent protein deacetylase [Clostridium sp. MCC353]
MQADRIKEIIAGSSDIVCLLGLKVSMDCGCLNYRQEDGLYDLEMKYGYAPEEIFSASFYNTRPRQFFEFYRNEILNRPGVPGPCHQALARMEQNGNLKAVITRELFSLSKRAGCRHVIELHGSIYQNICPRCGKKYTIDYMKKNTPIPLCEKCGIPVRPSVRLMGEMLNSKAIAQAALEVEKADTLLVLGCHLNAHLAANFLPYYKGNKLILINEEKHFMDRRADYMIHEKPGDVLPGLI